MIFRVKMSENFEIAFSLFIIILGHSFDMVYIVKYLYLKIFRYYHKQNLGFLVKKYELYA